MAKKEENMPKKRHGCLGALVSFVLVIALICAGLIAAAKLVPVTIKPADNAGELAVDGTLPGDWVNILLLGADSDAYARSDTIIIASVHSETGEVKLTSILRDTYVSIDGHGKNKINTATHFGGVDLGLKTVNQCFGMNISKYAMVDFSAFAYIVDAIGGIEVNVTEAEKNSINQLMGDMRVLYPDIELPKNDLTEFGEGIHLDGMQALAFARIRKLDSDYNRTSRQRMAIRAMMNKVMAIRNPSELYRLYQIVMDNIQTNLTTSDIFKLGAKVLLGGADFEELRIPADGTYSSQTINGMDCIVPDLEVNTRLLHEFIYGPD